MGVDKNITTYGAGNTKRKKGLMGGAGGDVRGYNVAQGTVLGTAGHTYANGGWVGADTDAETDSALGSTSHGPPQWRSGGHYVKGDVVTEYLSGVKREYKCIRDVGVGGTYPNVTGSAGVTHVGSTTIPSSDATHWSRVDNTYGLRRSQGGLSPGAVTGLSVGNGATTGTITVSWTGNTPTATCTYELVALRPDMYWDVENDVQGNPRTTAQRLENTYIDPDDLSGLTVNGDTYPIAGSGRMLETAAAAASAETSWDIRDIVAAGYDVVVGIRAVNEADTTGVTRQEVGRRGPWAWATGTSRG